MIPGKATAFDTRRYRCRGGSHRTMCREVQGAQVSLSWWIASNNVQGGTGCWGVVYT